MKYPNRLLVVLGALVVPSFALYACDLCGCANSGNTFGVLTLSPRSFLALHHQNQQFSSDAHGSEPNSVEYFRTVSLRSRWYVHRKVQVVASVPYVLNKQIFEDGNALVINNLGDVSIHSFVNCISKNSKSDLSVSHALILGGGMKIPTGKSNSTYSFHENSKVPIALQAGTGSFDGLFSAMYFLKKSKNTLAVESSLRLNTKNSAGSTLGHQSLTQVSFNRNWKFRGVNFMPSVGIVFDIRQKDQGTTQTETGGYAISGSGACQLFFKNTGLSISAQNPFFSHFSKGRVRPRNGLEAAFYVFFGGKQKLDVLEKSKNKFQNIITN